MIKKFLKKNWLILLILLIAAFLRLYRISAYTEFLGDQGRDVMIIKDLLKNGNLFFIGPQTSIGNMYLGPYFYYLITPSLWLANYSPLGPAIFIALINIATVYLIYFVAKKWFTKPVAYTSAFLFAISPVVIKYSNFIWNPNIMPFFTLLFVYFFFTAFQKENYRYFIYAVLAFVMMINSHYLALAILPLAGFYWLLRLIKYIRSKSKDKAKKLKSFIINTLLAFLVFIVSLTPQVLFDVKHDGQNFKALMTFFTQRETTVNIKAYKAIPELPTLFTQVNTRLLAGRDINIGLIVTIIFTVLLLFYLIKDFRNKEKWSKKESFYYIFLWYLFGLIALALYKQHVYDHYFSFIFPAVFILIAILINKFKVIGVPLLLLIVVYSFINNPFSKPANYQISHAQDIAIAITEHINEEDGLYNVTLLASYNDFRALAPRYFLLANDKNSQNLLDQEKYQQAQTLFVILDDPQKWSQGVDSDIWEINVFGSKEIVEEFESSDGVKIFKLVHTQDDQENN